MIYLIHFFFIPSETLYDKIVQRLGKASSLFTKFSLSKFWFYASDVLSTIKFAAYRVACKIRVLQKYLKRKFANSKKIFCGCIFFII